MPLNTKTFDQFIQDLSAAWAASLNLNPVLVPGDPVLAIFEVEGAQLLFLQALAITVNKLARASTAENGDLDTWMADFDFLRLPSTKATGQVTFRTITPKVFNIPIPVGTIVQTAGGAIIFQVVADTDLTSFSPTQNAYILSAGQTTVSATVEALVAGAFSNAQAGQINEIGSNLGSIDGVFNPLAITNGQDAEPDAKLRERFVLYINSLEKATRKAILSQVLNTQLNIQASLLENVDVNGDPLPGSFVTVIDDGSGAPPQALIDLVQNRIDVVRAFTVMQTVVAVDIVNVSILLDIKIRPTVLVEQDVIDQVEGAVVAYVNGLGIGETLYLHKLTQVAIDSSADVLSVEPDSVRINSLEADKQPTPFERLKTSLALTVVGTY